MAVGSRRYLSKGEIIRLFAFAGVLISLFIAHGYLRESHPRASLAIFILIFSVVLILMAAMAIACWWFVVVFFRDYRKPALCANRSQALLYILGSFFFACTTTAGAAGTAIHIFQRVKDCYA